MHCTVNIYFLIFFIVPVLLQTQFSNKCGRPFGNQYRLKMDRIVAGYDVGYYRYSWYSALMEGNIPVCGGVLVAPRTVLTAASCYRNYLGSSGTIYRRLEDAFNVTLGMYNSCIPEDRRQSYRVEKVNIHEHYFIRKPFYDIALLTLINTTDQYKPICLPSKSAPKPLEGIVIGMGALKFNGSLPCTLHEARLLIYPENKCTKIIEDSGNNVSSMEHVFCAGYNKDNINTCQGDIGSPLQVLNEDGHYVLLGLASFGFHCARPNTPEMYTDISKYLDWIYQKSGLYFYNTPSPPNKEAALTYGQPFKKIIKIIIIQNGHITVIQKPVWHYPIIHI